MHRNMVGLVALDLILRVMFTRMVRISPVIEIIRVDLDYSSADVSGFRVPGHMIADIKSLRHGGPPEITGSRKARSQDVYEPFSNMLCASFRKRQDQLHGVAAADEQGYQRIKNPFYQTFQGKAPASALIRSYRRSSGNHFA